ncbi:50S ribosomal protein L40e [Candidatus Woesearchaeota archaeon]|nr:50S ribosomal protein L40e [Candidatus Woesearchaeota archaeon]
MVKFPEAQVRLFKNVFICRRCKTKQRTQPLRVIQKTISCRKCGCNDLRPVRKK